MRLQVFHFDRRKNMSKDQLKDSQYDGIQEYDNDLPKWWVGTFIITVLFGFGYWVYYHNFSGPGQTQQYDQKLKSHQAKYAAKSGSGDLSDDRILALLDSAADIEEGKGIYTQNCVACHAANGGGGIGPNLTDNAWIHGANPLDIYGTIENGIVEKGMLAWKGILTTSQMQKVTAYVLTLKNTNVVNGKAPQGDVVE